MYNVDSDLGNYNFATRVSLEGIDRLCGEGSKNYPYTSVGVAAHRVPGHICKVHVQGCGSSHNFL